MSTPEERPAGRDFVHVEKSSVKFVRNAKGDTQVEVRVVAGTDAFEMAGIRELAFTTYKQAVEETGGLVS